MASNTRTDVLLKVLGSVRAFIDEHHYSPTLREICDLVRCHSKGTIEVHLRALRDLGLLRWQPGQERTFVVTDRALVAQEVVKAYLAMRGVSGDLLPWHYRLRNLLRRPEVCLAIEDLMDTRGFSRRDAFALAGAYIKGEVEVVRFTPDGKPMKVKLPSYYRALHDYFVMTGWLS